MRTKGAKNKPKFIEVTVGDLIHRFSTDTKILISIKYAILFNKPKIVRNII